MMSMSDTPFKPYWKHLFDCALDEMDKRDVDRAIQLFKLVIEERPDLVAPYVNLGSALWALQRSEEAERAFRGALAIEPYCDEALMNLAIILAERGCESEAIDLFHRSLEVKPTAIGYTNLGTLYRRLGIRLKAMEALEQAYKLDPNDAKIRMNLSMELLLFGRFTEGWMHYAACLPDVIRSETDHIIAKDTRLWNGEQTGHLVIHHDQGIGDTIQSARYINSTSQKCERLTLVPQTSLVSLLTKVFADNPKITVSENVPEHYDCYQWIDLLMVGSGCEPIPNDPYIKIVSNDRWKFVRRFPHLRVGIAWAGNKDQIVDSRRSIPFDMFDELFKVSNVSFLSLQVDRKDRDKRLYDMSHHLRNWESTAGIIQELDLVISVDTAVAHLAGAMGKPVWLLNRFDNCWRWQIDRNDTDWYPTMRIFRQPSLGDWTSVITETRAALEQLAAKPR